MLIEANNRSIHPSVDMLVRVEIREVVWVLGMVGVECVQFPWRAFDKGEHGSRAFRQGGEHGRGE